MKVKVSYTADSEQVPGIVDELLRRCKQKLLKYSNLEYNLYQMPKFIREIEEAVEDLRIISDQLIDCVHMANGYSDLKKAEEEHEHEQRLPHDVPPPPEEPEDLDTNTGNEDEVD